MLKRIGAEEGGEFKAVASGTLPSGRPVVVNADGTVSVVAETPVTESAGTPVEWNSNVIRYTSAAYDANAQKVVVAYYDFGDSGHGYAVVGTVSGTSISFGTPVEFENAEIDDTAISYDTNSQKVLITYQDVGNSNYGTAIVGTVSGTSISFGTATVFKSASTFKHASVYDPDSQKIIIASGQNAASPQAAVATISGTSVSFGSLATYGGTNDTGHAMAYDTNTDRVVIAYRDGSNTYSNVVVGTVSGTSISFGTEVVFSGSGTEEDIGIAYDSDNQKIVIGFTQSDVAKGIVGTVSGTSISFGTAVNFNSGNTAFKIRAVYDSNAQKVVFFFRGAPSTYYGQAVSGTVSGTSISFGSVTTFQSSRTEEIAAVYDANAQKSVVVYRDFAAGRGDAVVFTTGYTSQNLTSENYIGMSRGVAFQTGSDTTFGTAVQFESGNIQKPRSTYATVDDKIVIAYADLGNSYYGTAVVGTVSGTSITFETPVVFNSQQSNADIAITYDPTAASNDGRVFIAFQNGSTNTGKCKTGYFTEAGNIAFNGEETFRNNDLSQLVAAFDSNANKTLLVYRNALSGPNKNEARVVTISADGSTPSFGTEVFLPTQGDAHVPSRTNICFDSNVNKFLVIWYDSNDGNKGKSAVGTISGTNVSFGSTVTFHDASTDWMACSFDPDTNKILVVYEDAADSNKGKAVVGTISGTSISYGSEVTFRSATTGFSQIGTVYDTNLNAHVITYYNASGTANIETVTAQISGTTATFSTPVVLTNSVTDHIAYPTFDPDTNKVIVAYRDDDDSGKGKAVVLTPALGINTTRGEVADGGNASMDIIGSVSDNQIGLTAGQQYFVQNDGTISTTADSPSVLAGTAISATELVVKT